MRASHLTAAVALLAASALAPPTARADMLEGDPQFGEILFGVCSSCHEIGEGAGHRTGPSLNNLVGSPAGERGGYPASFLMVLSGLRGLVWTPETLDKFLADPQAVVPNNAMTFIGIEHAQERADLIAYLVQAGDVAESAETGAETEAGADRIETGDPQ